MTAFTFTPLVNDPHADVITAALGVDANNKLNDNDIGKPVKLAANDNYVLCGDGDDIEGFLVSTEASTVNDGFALGSVKRNKRFKVQVEAGELGTAAVGTYVCAGIPAVAINVKQTWPQVILKTLAADSAKWRVISIVSGTGVAGDLILIERT